MTPLRIGTRGSALALWQAKHIQQLLQPIVEPRPVELIEISTQGDETTHLRLHELGGDGVFTKRIQLALIDNQVDIAVHSLKDLPTLPFEGLTLASVPERGPIGDVLVSEKYQRFDELPEGGSIATGSLRRVAQIKYHRPDLTLIDNIRGNVDTRLQKLRDENYDGIILAEAGLVRLGRAEVISEVLDRTWILPAVGQGALGLECREGDEETRAILGRVNHPETHDAVLAERGFLRRLAAGCHVPVGAYATVNEATVHLQGVVMNVAGTKKVTGKIDGPSTEADSLGVQLAEQLIEQGAADLLAETSE